MPQSLRNEHPHWSEYYKRKRFFIDKFPWNNYNITIINYNQNGKRTMDQDIKIWMQERKIKEPFVVNLPEKARLGSLPEKARLGPFLEWNCKSWEFYCIQMPHGWRNEYPH